MHRESRAAEQQIKTWKKADVTACSERALNAVLRFPAIIGTETAAAAVNATAAEDDESSAAIPSFFAVLFFEKSVRRNLGPKK
mmetsp:Transcript_64367/g.114419  ORF Transcript_64367/g.114419 Transcript_64367/m.114419 type:complete len:83 (-) Transcript_64367:200-448(-)